MNVLSAKITDLKVDGHLTLVILSAIDIELSAIVVDSPETAPYLEKGNLVKVLFKETEVIISQRIKNRISLQNQFNGIVSKIETGSLLSRIMIDTSAGEITAHITSKSVIQLELKKGDQIIVMIKTNELMLAAQ